MRDTFSDCHPAVNFAYFALVLGFSMTLMHPVCLLISLTGACCYLARLHGLRELGHSARWLVPMALLAALVNPAFVHQGVTILTYLPSGNPLTLESILYGLAAALLLASVVLWFRCFSAVMTSDKFIYLFGRAIPALSLVLSMTLRFVPRFRRQFHTVAQAQRFMGRDTGNGSLLQRCKNAMKVFSIMVTWSLESAIDTADSMRSRGYGQPGRTAFSIKLPSGQPRPEPSPVAGLLRHIPAGGRPEPRPVLPVLPHAGGRAPAPHHRQLLRGIPAAVSDARTAVVGLTAPFPPS